MTMSRGLLFLAVMLAQVGAWPAAAYCTLHPSSGAGSLNRFATGGSRNGQGIPVYLVASGANSVYDDPAKTNSDGLGLTSLELEAAVRSVCRSWAEGAAKVRPYYAGTRSNIAPQEGLIIYSPDSMSAQTQEIPVFVSSGVYGAAIIIAPRNPGVIEYISGTKDDSNDPSYVRTIRSTLLHEMTHMFQGEAPHPLTSGEACQPELGYVTNDPEWCGDDYNPSCVGSHASALSLLREYVTSDDQLGTMARFGGNARTLHGWSSPTGVAGTWQENLVLPAGGLYSRVPPSISAPTTEYRATGSAIALTDVSDIIYISYDGGSGYGPTERVGGALSANRTVQRPLIAIGNGSIVVQWFSMDDLDCESQPIEFCKKTISNGTWLCDQAESCAEAPSPPQTRMAGLSFDGIGDRFVLSHNQTIGYKPTFVQTIDEGDGDPMDSESLGAGGSRNVGKSACQPQVLPTAGTSDCYTISASSVSYRASIRRWHVASGVLMYDASHTKAIGEHFGHTDFALGDNNVFVAARSRTSSSSGVYRFVGYNQSATDTQDFTANYWPIAVGAMRTWTFAPPVYVSSTTFRLIVAP